MKPTLRKGVLLTIAAAIVAGALSVAAQTLPVAARDSLTPDERDLLTAFEEDRLITARRLAEELLAKDENSMVGQYVLGSVMRRSEGNLQEAARRLGRARELYETTWSVAPAPEGAPWQLHREILYAMIELAQELEQPSYRLDLIEYYDAIYNPDLHAERAWTLLALERFDDARAAADQALQASGEGDRSLGLNARCAIETEAGTRALRLEACRDALDNAIERAARTPETDPVAGVNVAVHAYNAGLAALAALQIDEAESLVREGTRRLAYTPANPWRLLTRLTLAQGRSLDAVTALTEMDRWRQRQPPYLRDQARAESEAVFAQLMLVAGRTDEALSAITRSIDRPDRRGLTSADAEQAVGAYALTRLAVQAAHEELQAESAAAWGLQGGAPFSIRVANALQRTADIERVRATLSTERLVETVRPYSPQSLDIPIWLTGDLVDIAGPGVVEVAIHRARRSEELRDEAAPWLDAVEAEVHIARGDLDRGRQLAERALAALPQSEVLLRARLAARLGALAIGEREMRDQALGWLAMARELDPSVLRRLRIALPARITGSDDPTVAQAVERLEQSPRFEAGDGFGVQVSGSTAALRICLSGPLGDELLCTDTERDAEDDDDTFLARAIFAFHTQAFSMPVQLNSVSLSTLDGRTSASSAAAREDAQTLLDAVLAGRQPTTPPPATETPTDGAPDPLQPPAPPSGVPPKPPRPQGWR